MTQPKKAHQLAGQTLHMLPTALDTLEKNNTHKIITGKLTEQLRSIELHQISSQLLGWMVSGNRYRQLLAPVLAHLASALASNKDRIEEAAGKKAPLTKVPLLGRISRAIAEDFSERTADNIEAKLIAASQDETEPLWDIIHEQIIAAQGQFQSNPELKTQLETIRDQWLENPQSGELADRLWSQIRETLQRDLAAETPKSIDHLSSVIIAIGSSVEKNPDLAQKIETTLLEGIEQILTKHGTHIETMIRQTIEEWDANTLMEKLEHQVGPDLQFIRINGTLIGGLVGLALHGIGLLVWH